MPLKYEKVAEELIRQIADGTYPPGSKLPPSRELAEQLRVSRATVITALDMLKEDALIVGRQGSGYWVVESAVGRPAGDRQADRSRASGGMPFQRLGKPTREVPPTHISQALGLENGALALRRARLMLDEGEPHSLVTAWFPLDIADACPKLESAAAIPEGTTSYVASRTGRVPAVGVDDEVLRQLTPEEARLLGLAKPKGCHVLLHVAVDDRGGVLVVEEGVTPEGVWSRTTKYAMRPRS